MAAMMDFLKVACKAEALLVTTAAQSGRWVGFGGERWRTPEHLLSSNRYPTGGAQSRVSIRHSVSKRTRSTLLEQPAWSTGAKDPV